jgi:hypothetical protein
MEVLQVQFSKAGYLLEDYSLWAMGEPVPHKYICMSGKGRHLAYFNTLAEARIWLKDSLMPIQLEVC